MNPTNGRKRTTKPKTIGRPSIYSRAVSDEICRRLAEGEPLTRICRLANMPSLSTVYRWLDGYTPQGRQTEEAARISAAFREAYMRARMDQADTLAAEIIEIADNAEGDQVVRVNEKGQPYTTTDYDNIQRSRLRVEARKWCAAKLKPKVYGDKVMAELTGAGGGPVQTESVVTDASAQLAVVRAKMMAALTASGGAPAGPAEVQSAVPAAPK